jgi:hypothetical protein
MSVVQCDTCGTSYPVDLSDGRERVWCTRCRRLFLIARKPEPAPTMETPEPVPAPAPAPLPVPVQEPEAAGANARPVVPVQSSSARIISSAGVLAAAGAGLILVLTLGQVHLPRAQPPPLLDLPPLASAPALSPPSPAQPQPILQPQPQPTPEEVVRLYQRMPADSAYRVQAAGPYARALSLYAADRLQALEDARAAGRCAEFIDGMAELIRLDPDGAHGREVLQRGCRAARQGQGNGQRWVAKAREEGPKEEGPREEGPKEAGLKEAGLKEAGPKEAGPKEAGPKEARLKEARLKEARPKEAARPAGETVAGRGEEKPEGLRNPF